MPVEYGIVDQDYQRYLQDYQTAVYFSERIEI